MTLINTHSLKHKKQQNSCRFWSKHLNLHSIIYIFLNGYHRKDLHQKNLCINTHTYFKRYTAQAPAMRHKLACIFHLSSTWLSVCNFVYLNIICNKEIQIFTKKKSLQHLFPRLFHI